MTEEPGAHQVHDSSHQSISNLALIGLIGDHFPSLQQNHFPPGIWVCLTAIHNTQGSRCGMKD